MLSVAVIVDNLVVIVVIINIDKNKECREQCWQSTNTLHKNNKVCWVGLGVSEELVLIFAGCSKKQF